MVLQDYIIVNGYSKSQFDETLDFLLSEYQHGSKDSPTYIYIFQLTNNHDNYIISVIPSPDFTLLGGLVNLFRHSSSKDPFTAPPLSIGYYSIKEADELGEEFNDKRAMLYVSKYDKDFDNVSFICEGSEHPVLMSFRYGAEPAIQPEKELEFLEPEINLKSYSFIGQHELEPYTERKTSRGCVPALALATVLIGIGSYLFA